MGKRCPNEANHSDTKRCSTCGWDYQQAKPFLEALRPMTDRCDRGPEPYQSPPWKNYAEGHPAVPHYERKDREALVYRMNNWHARCDALDAAVADCDALNLEISQLRREHAAEVERMRASLKRHVLENSRLTSVHVQREADTLGIKQDRDAEVERLKAELEEAHLWWDERNHLRTRDAKLAALAELLVAEIAKIEADPRHHYEPALVQVNAPLALIQVEMTARKQALKEAEQQLRAIIGAEG